jgi:Na+/H+-translocating membrane pyrophosphatase
MNTNGLRGAKGTRKKVQEIRTSADSCSYLFRSNLRARWFAVVLASLLAFSWQSFVTQTHVHFDPGASSTAAAGKAGGGAHEKAGRSSSDIPANCPICQEIAHAGHYFLPTPVAFLGPYSVAVWIVVTPSLALTLRQRSHTWNSRAPPRQLQA